MQWHVKRPLCLGSFLTKQPTVSLIRLLPTKLGECLGEEEAIRGTKDQGASESLGRKK